VVAESVFYYEAKYFHYFVSDEPTAHCSYPQWWWILSVGKVS